MNIEIQFTIEYFTQWGQNLYVSGNIDALGSGDAANAVKMNYTGNGKWGLELKFKKRPEPEIRYKYFLKDDKNEFMIWEWGDQRTINLSNISHTNICLHDYWRPGKNVENVFFSSSFTGNLM